MEAEGSQEEPPQEPPPPPTRGRPKGKADAKARVRRTAAQVAADKIALAQAKVDALRLQEEAKLAEREAKRKRPARVTVPPKKPPPPPESSSEEEPPPPKKKKPQAPPPSDSSSEEPAPLYQRPSPRTRRKALYQSWFAR